MKKLLLALILGVTSLSIQACNINTQSGCPNGKVCIWSGTYSTECVDLPNS